MPNWVFNNVYEYPEEIYNKYKGKDEGEELAIDFDKIIPEPEDIKHAPSGSFNEPAKRIYQYGEYIKGNTPSKYDHRNPLYDTVQQMAKNTYEMVGEVCIINHDKSLDNIMDSVDKDAHPKFNSPEFKIVRMRDAVEAHNKIFEDKTYSTYPEEDLKNIYDNYCKLEEDKFANLRNAKKVDSPITIKDEVYEFESLNDMGKFLIQCKEKYGFDNWYDWRNANWGTKWNACDSDYNPDTKTLTFNTAWCVPVPILSKIAEDNPELNMEVYSEEETGWFEEYDSNNGVLRHTDTGELQYNEETDTYEEHREEVNPPEELPYSTIGPKYIEDWKEFSDRAINAIY